MLALEAKVTSLKVTEVDWVDEVRRYLAGPAAERGESAWRRFYATHDKVIRRFVRAHRIRAHEVDDCVQEVWLAVLVALRSPDSPPWRDRILSWLSGVARNKAADIVRRRLRAEVIRGAAAEEVARRQRARSQRNDQLPRLAWEKELLTVCLGSLRESVSDTAYALFLDVRLRGKPLVDVAQSLQLSVRQAQRLHQATRSQFQELYESFGGQP